jgi:hypothetical protein
VRKLLSFKRFTVGAPLAALIVLGVVSVAIADNVQVNDTLAGDSVTNATAGTRVASVRIQGNSAAGDVAGCNVEGAPATVTLSSNKSWITFPSGNSATITACGPAGAKTISYTISNSAPAGETATISTSTTGGKAGSVFNEDTFTVSTPPPPPDTTPPVISYTLDPPAPDGGGGWYKSPVSVDWTVTDNESTITSTSADCADTTKSSDGTYSLTCQATSSGGTSSATASFKIDQTAPVVQCGTADGIWHKTDVAIACTADDGSGSGSSGLFNSNDASFTLETTVAAGTETSNASTGSRLVSDVAGNTATVGPVSGNKVDKKAPDVDCDTPAPTFTVNQSPANVTGTATDGGSGPASQNVSKPATTSSVGSKTVSLTADDAVGNTGSATCSYSVLYGFDGLFAPIDRPDTRNVSKAGQAIPLKWRLVDANGAPVTTLASVIVQVSSLSCTLGTTDDLVEEYAANASGLQNLGDGYYQFNWKSPTSYANSCKSLKLDLGEGTPRTVAYVQFKK